MMYLLHQSSERDLSSHVPWSYCDLLSKEQNETHAYEEVFGNFHTWRLSVHKHATVFLHGLEIKAVDTRRTRQKTFLLYLQRVSIRALTKRKPKLPGSCYFVDCHRVLRVEEILQSKHYRLMLYTRTSWSSSQDTIQLRVTVGIHAPQSTTPNNTPTQPSSPVTLSSPCHLRIQRHPTNCLHPVPGIVSASSCRPP